MNIELILKEHITQAFQSLFSHEMSIEDVVLQPTRKEFEGSHTLVCFPFARISKKNPEETAKSIGEYLKQESDQVHDFNVVKGFLNIVLEDKVWIAVLKDVSDRKNYGQLADSGKEVMVEYSSPNTNKPLHLGHLRNIFLGYSEH